MFAVLVQRYQDYAYGTAIGMLSEFELARDVVQEAFLLAFRDLDKLREPAKFGSWLQGIVRNVSRHAIRELTRVRQMADALSRQTATEDRSQLPYIADDQAERRAMVARALQQLGQKNREAVSLFYVNGLSYGKIADYLGVTEAAVRGRLERGRAKLRRELTMVAKAFKEQELPDDFATRVRRLLDAAAGNEDRNNEMVRELSALGTPAVDPLQEALHDERQVVRIVAAQALCEIGDERALRGDAAYQCPSERF